MNTTESAQGTVVDFNADTYTIIAYVFNGQWWCQHNTFLTINDNGDFEYPIASPTATVYALFVLPQGYSYPKTLERALPSLPDSLFRDSRAFVLEERLPSNRTLSFSGYTWHVKHYGEYVYGPETNFWNEDNAWVDSLGRLHLRITYDPVTKRYFCAEVISDVVFSTGEMTLTKITPISELHDSSVVGFFNWDENPYEASYDKYGQNYRDRKLYNFNNEYDIELSKVFHTDNSNAIFVVQPHEIHTPIRFNIIKDTIISMRFIKEDSNLRFACHYGTAPFTADNLIQAHQYSGTDYISNTGRMRINYWLFHKDSTGIQEGEVIFDSFDYSALSSVTDRFPENHNMIQGYPNPFRNTFSLKYDDQTTEPIRVEIYNVLGQKIYSQVHYRLSATQNRFIIDGSLFQSGLYLCIVRDGAKTHSIIMSKY